MKKWMALLLVCTMLLPGLAGAEGPLLLHRQTLPAGVKMICETEPRVLTLTMEAPGLLTRMGLGVKSPEAAAEPVERYDAQFVFDEDQNWLCTRVTRTENGVVLWETDVPKNRSFITQEVSEGVLLGGDGFFRPNRLSLLSPEGRVLWTRDTREDGQKWKRIAVDDNLDGTWTIWGYTGSTADTVWMDGRWTNLSGGEVDIVLHMQRMRSDGVLLWEKELTCQEMHLPSTEYIFLSFSPLRVEDGWLLVMGDGCGGYAFVRLDAEGTPLWTWSYDGSDRMFDPSYLKLADGALYLSGVLVAGDVTPSPYGAGYWQLADIPLTVKALGRQWPIYATFGYDPRLTPRIRDHYTAVLLRIDPFSGDMTMVYTADGCLGGALATDAAGRLTWDVESLQCCGCSIYASSHTFYGISKVFRCVLDEQGEFYEMVDVGVNVPFWR